MSMTKADWNRHNAMMQRKTVEIFLDAQPGERIDKTAERARTFQCEFFIFNGYCVPSCYPDLPEGTDFTDCPKISAWYLRGRLEDLQEAIANRPHLGHQRLTKIAKAIASLTPQQREDLGL